MRISTDERDRGWAKLQEWGGHCCGARIYLDSVEMKLCVTADEELGEVLVFAEDDAGKPVMDGDDYRREWRRGKVVIVMPGRDEPVEEWPKRQTVTRRFDFLSNEAATEAVRDAARAAIGPADFDPLRYATAFPEALKAVAAAADEAAAAARVEAMEGRARRLMQRFLITTAYLARDD